MQWIVSIAILIAAIWIIPASVRSMSNSRKGRLGSAFTGMADALDPHRALIVEEMEKRQNEDGEEASGEAEDPLKR